MKSIKTKLIFTILGVVFCFALLFFAGTLTELTIQQNTIREKAGSEGNIISEETGETLNRLEKTTADQFSVTCSKYFNSRLENIRKHLSSVREKIEDMYRSGETISFDSDSRYEVDELKLLDLYYIAESGECIDYKGLRYKKKYAGLRGEEWYRQVKTTGRTYWSDILPGEDKEMPHIICAVPVYGADMRFKGCAVCEILAENLVERVEDYTGQRIVSLIFFDQYNKLMHASGGYEDTARVKEDLAKKETTIHGDEIYAYTEIPETGWTICLVLDQKELRDIMDNLGENVKRTVNETGEIVQSGIQKIMLILIVVTVAGLLAAVFVSRFLAAGFVKPIHKLMGHIRRVGSGDLSVNIPIESKDEIGQLAEAFQKMTGELQNHMNHLQSMTAEKERMSAEVDVARGIQMNMLPAQYPAFPGQTEFEIYANVRAADKGGGSFYDYFIVKKRYLCMVMGDVTGTGIPTTLFAVIAKTHMKNYAMLQYSTDRILMETNNQLSANNSAGLNVSAFIGMLDLQSGRLQYSAAGDMASLWKHSGADFKLLTENPGFALGNMENVPYRKETIRLSQGDMLFIHTGGMAEAVDERESMYSEVYLYERLRESVKNHYQIKDIADSIEKNVIEFEGGAVQKRDSTLMLFRYYGE